MSLPLHDQTGVFWNEERNTIIESLLKHFNYLHFCLTTSVTFLGYIYVNQSKLRVMTPNWCYNLLRRFTGTSDNVAQSSYETTQTFMRPTKGLLAISWQSRGWSGTLKPAVPTPCFPSRWSLRSPQNCSCYGDNSGSHTGGFSQQQLWNVDTSSKSHL